MRSPARVGSVGGERERAHQRQWLRRGPSAPTRSTYSQTRTSSELPLVSATTFPHQHPLPVWFAHLHGANKLLAAAGVVGGEIDGHTLAPAPTSRHRRRHARILFHLRHWICLGLLSTRRLWRRGRLRRHRRLHGGHRTARMRASRSLSILSDVRRHMKGRDRTDDHPLRPDGRRR